MERIKEAIERAKAAQAESDGQAVKGPAAPRAPGTGQAAPAAAEAASTAEVPAEIQYRQTRVVEPKAKQLETNRIVSFRKSDAHTVSFDRLRTQILRKMQDNGWRTLAITSPAPKCGKTTTALNLSMSVAHHTEQTVLLADLDMRDPRIAQYLGLPKAPSLVDYLNGEVELPEVLVNPGIPRLTILPNHTPTLKAAELIMTRRMKDLVSDLRNRYESRLVIFDLPALLTTDDALAFLPQVDCVLLVVENGATKKSEIKDAMRLLQNTPVVGTVLNKA